jgi:iron(III) transport system substrate-binding protein
VTATSPSTSPGDYATRKDITSHPDAVPLGEFKAWQIDPARTAEIRKEIGDLVLLLQ